jgi:phage baseplate assembly protein W
MARYIRHTVRYGETLQSIAAKEMGDATSWTDIAKYNGLSYPYIVDTVDQKMNNMEHLVTAGDTLVIPVEVELTEDLAQKLNQQDRDALGRLALGQDLSMIDFPPVYQNRGTQENIMQLGSNGKGDLSTVYGVNNIKQIVIAHLLTAKGSLILHPEYGSNLNELFVQGTIPNSKLVDDEISKAILSDSRITKAEKQSSTLNGSTYSSSWSITIESVVAQLDFVIGRDDTGKFIIQ